MKKLILITFSALMFMLSSAVPALADGVVFNYEAYFGSPDLGSKVATEYVPFRGTDIISFKVAGQKCELPSSGGTFAPQGCNYHVYIAADGTLTGYGDCIKDVATACKPIN